MRDNPKVKQGTCIYCGEKTEWNHTVCRKCLEAALATGKKRGRG